MSATKNYPNFSITGKMGSGKTTLSQYLIQHHGYIQSSFAKSLKAIVEVLNEHDSPFRAMFYAVTNYGIRPYAWRRLYQILNEARKLPLEIPKARTRLQFVGNAVRDRISKNFWVEIAMEDIRTQLILDPDARFVFDDARYPNEIDFLKEQGFMDIRIFCPDKIRFKRLKVLYNMTSPDDPRLTAESEVAADTYSFTHTITNAGGDDPFRELDFLISLHDVTQFKQVFPPTTVK